MNRRKRIIVHCHLAGTLKRIRDALGRSVEFVVAGDVPTLEAAVRLYRHVEAIVVEKKPRVDLPLNALRLASEQLPEARRLVLVDCECTSGVPSALSSGLITKLVLLPFRSDELAAAIGVELEFNPRATPAMLTRR